MCICTRKVWMLELFMQIKHNGIENMVESKITFECEHIFMEMYFHYSLSSVTSLGQDTLLPWTFLVPLCPEGVWSKLLTLILMMFENLINIKIIESRVFSTYILSCHMGDSILDNQGGAREIMKSKAEGWREALQPPRNAYVTIISMPCRVLLCL